MSIPAGRKTANINRSIQMRIGDQITADSTGARGQAVEITAQIHHGDPWADPEAINTPSTTPALQWITTTWVQQGAGRRGASLLQVDVYSAIGGPGTLDGDPHGVIANDLADAIEGLFAGRFDEGRGQERAFIQISDYATPTAPVQTNHWALCAASTGARGAPTGSQGHQGGGFVARHPALPLPPVGGSRRPRLDPSLRLIPALRSQ